VSDAEGFAFVGGVVLDLASIPFFISAGHNKKMATKIAFGNQQSYLLRKNVAAVRYAPSVSFQLPFKTWYRSNVKFTS
jgi:hypothetical protein